jgi:hypothetical protein
MATWAQAVLVALVVGLGGGILKMLFDIKTSLATIIQKVSDHDRAIDGLEDRVYAPIRPRRNPKTA